jgi:hypothetical protein
MPQCLPQRIQCRRDRPWQITPKAIYVGRPSRWGNPYRVGVHGTAEECVRRFDARYGDDGRLSCCRARRARWESAGLLVQGGPALPCGCPPTLGQ